MKHGMRNLTQVAQETYLAKQATNPIVEKVLITSNPLRLYIISFDRCGKEVIRLVHVLNLLYLL